MKAIIIDDEKNNIENLRGLLSKHCPDVNIIATATNAKDGKKIIEQNSIEILFLDIQMPEQNGFDLLLQLPEHNFEIIFVTAYDQYGIQAIKFAAIDYLLKPVNVEELKVAVQKAKIKIAQKRQNLKLENLLSLLQSQQQKTGHMLALPTSKETRFVNPKDIIRCESNNAYTSFYLSNGEVIMVSKPIYEYDELLQDYGFIRCHQSHLINKIYVKSMVRADGHHLLLVNGETIPVSRAKKEMIIAALNLLTH